MQASEIISKAATLLLDPTNVRWPTEQLLDYINDGQKEIVIHRPDASVSDEVVTLTDGNTRQTIPADAIRLMTVVRNMGDDGATPGNPVMVIDRHILDTQIPAWHASTPSSQIKHFIYDPMAPTVFYVYPRPAANVNVEIIVSVPPVKLLSVGNDLTISEIYSNAILDYVLYRAFSKDSEYADQSKAANYYSSFLAILGIKTKIDIAVTPRGQTK